MKPTDTIPTIIVILGTIAGFVLALSPIPMASKVYKNKELGYYRPDAFIAGLVFGIANGTYSLYSNQIISFISTAITLTLYAGYLSIFIFFGGKERRSIIRKASIAIMIGSFFTGVGPIVFHIVDSTTGGKHWLDQRGGPQPFIRTWLGVCAAISITLLLSGQLSGMLKVIKTRDSRPISTYMMIGGLVCSLTWTIYASLIVDPYYITANGIGVLSGVILLALKLKYRSPIERLDDKRIEMEDRVATDGY